MRNDEKSSVAAPPRSGKPAVPGSGLVLNLAPIQLSGTTVTGERLSLSAPAEVYAARNDIRETHVLRWERDHAIAVPIVEDAPSVGAEKVDIDLSTHPHLACFLWREALVRAFIQRGIKLIRAVPVVIPSKATTDCFSPDPRWTAKAAIPALLQALNVRVAYEFNSRVVAPPAVLAPPAAIPVVAIGVAAVQQIVAPITEFATHGVDLVGADVGELRAVRDPRVDPEFRWLGRVRSCSSTEVVIDGREGSIARDPAQTFLEPSRWHVRRVLQKALPREWQHFDTELHERMSRLHRGDLWLQRLENALAVLQKDALALAPGLQATVGDLVEPAKWATGTGVIRADPPIYVFDPAGRKTDESNSRGLRRNGPYSRLAPIPRIPKVCLVTQASEQGTSERFLHKFLDGIENTVYDRGFLRTFGLEACQPVPFAARDGSARAYRDAAEQAVRSGREASEKDPGRRNPWDLAIVQVEERTHQLRGDDNPYLVTKAFFLSHQIPVQEFRIETARSPDAQLAWSLGNMALATYAKLGGIPWLLRADPTTTHELVVGMASTHVRRDRLDVGEKLVGITSVFSGDGSYFLHTVSQAVPMSEYSTALLRSLRDAITKVRQDRNWRSGERVRLVFHAFKPLKNAEAEAVKQLAAELTDFDLEFAFIHVAGDGELQLFDRSFTGVATGGGQAKGRNVPLRGWMVPISDRDILVSTTGARELKRASDGAPVPLLLHLHPASTFQDLRYLGQQVYAFSSHSWRGYSPNPMPVTIAYSQLIARLMGRLGTTSRWNPDVLCGRIETTRWFL